MMSARLARYQTTLNGLERRGRRRSLASSAGADFTSNDYLGLAGSPRLALAIHAALERGVPVGAGGSRLLRGNHAEHEALEVEAAAFFGTEGALYFSSGFSANTALFATLPQRGDLIVHDALMHASAREGIAASKAEAAAALHNDAGCVDETIRAWRRRGGTGHPWIAVESLYSMDGDRAPLADLGGLADKHEGFLMIDEAHATGVFGRDGRGLAAGFEGRDNVILLHTCGKALGLSGAFIGASRVICEFLINRARPFIYSTAPSPLIAAGVREALKILSDEPQRQGELGELFTFANAQLREVLAIEGSHSQILPVIIGSSSRALAIAERMRLLGFDIRAIRPPTVPDGTARLRISITLNVDKDAIASMIDTLAAVMNEVAA